MSTPNFSGAIDLSGLTASTTITPAAPKIDIPEGAFLCDVEDGCNLVVMGDGHADVYDCLATCYPYVMRYMETKNAAIEVAEEYHKAVGAYRTVLAANQRLAEDNDRLKADLRAARKGTEAGEKSVLAGAEDLAARMKTAFAPSPPPEPVVQDPSFQSLSDQPADARVVCKRCNKNDTDSYDLDGVPYVWCVTCQDDAQ